MRKVKPGPVTDGVRGHGSANDIFCIVLVRRTLYNANQFLKVAVVLSFFQCRLYTLDDQFAILCLVLLVTLGSIFRCVHGGRTWCHYCHVAVATHFRLRNRFAGLVLKQVITGSPGIQCVLMMRKCPSSPVIIPQTNLSFDLCVGLLKFWVLHAAFLVPVRNLLSLSVILEARFGMGRMVGVVGGIDDFRPQGRAVWPLVKYSHGLQAAC